MPVIAGGVEASLRRLAHYDYWSDTVRRSILLDARPTCSSTAWASDAIVEIAQRLAAGEDGARTCATCAASPICLGASEIAARPSSASSSPSYEALSPAREDATDKLAFAEATRIIHTNTNPFNAATLVQCHDRQAVVVQPAGAAVSRAGDGRDLRPALSRAGRTRPTPSRSPPTR